MKVLLKSSIQGFSKFLVWGCLLCMGGSTIAHEGFSIACEDEKVTIEYGGKLVTHYWYRDDVAKKPYFWPVMGPTGKRMTRSFPMETVAGEHHDHPHHRSVWFGHQGVAGTDTWLEEASKKVEGEKKQQFLATLGSTVHRAFTEISANHDQAIIRSRNDYLDSQGKQLMADRRSMTFQMGEDRLVLDFDITLLAPYGDVLLEDKKDAGLNVRIPTTMTLKNGSGHILNSNGIRDGATWSKKAAWVDYFGPVEGDLLGIAMLNHPESFRHPTRWHVRDYGLFTANAFGLRSLDKNSESGEFTLKQDDHVTLRHRIIFHKGNTSDAKIAEAFAVYSEE